MLPLYPDVVDSNIAARAEHLSFYCRLMHHRITEPFQHSLCLIRCTHSRFYMWLFQALLIQEGLVRL